MPGAAAQPHVPHAAHATHVPFATAAAGGGGCGANVPPANSGGFTFAHAQCADATQGIRAHPSPPAPFAPPMQARQATCTAGGSGNPTAGFASSGCQSDTPMPDAHTRGMHAATAGTAAGTATGTATGTAAGTDAGTAAGTSKRQRRTAHEIPEGTLREPQAAVAGCDLTNVPAGFPMGPIQGDVDQLKERLNYYTSNPRTGDGGFGVCRTRQPAKSKNKGDSLYMECYKHKKSGCKWRTNWEHTTEGWVLLNYLPHCYPAVDNQGNELAHMPSVPAANGHSHPLLHDESQVLSPLVLHA